MSVEFYPGNNIAMKIPSHEYSDTVHFYTNVLRLKKLSADEVDETPRFEFGDKILWLDRMSGLSQSEIWLEIVTNNIDDAAEYLKLQGCHRRDEIEPLPEGFNAFWISSPSNLIHLMSSSKDV